MSRSGWTLHEMLLSLAITGGIFVLASNAALGHLRFVRGAGEIAAIRGQLGHATGVTANVLRAVTSRDDILVALDTVADVRATYAAAFACDRDTGRVVVPAPRAGGPLAWFGDTPEPGDDVSILAGDDSGAVWIGARLAASPVAGGTCAAFPSESVTWSLPLVEPLVVERGWAVRIARRVRVSSYRASDGRWYLGIRDWNGTLNRFNTIQPVAGPLLPFSADRDRTGFLLSWIDSSGATLDPADPTRIAGIVATMRAETVRPARVAGLWSRREPVYEDSMVAAVPIRNR